MEAASRRSDTALIRTLGARPFAFEFFQAVRLLEARSLRDGGHGAVGGDERPENEAVRFRAEPSLAFPSSAIVKLKDPRDAGRSGPPEASVSFLGLIGPSGVLPHHYTELLIRRLQLNDRALRDFLDLFQHRAVSLFFRAWRKYRLAFDFEHEALTTGGVDDATRALYALVGLGSGGLRGLASFEPQHAVYFAGAFARPTRTCLGLAGMLGDLLGIPIHVDQFIGRWIPLDPLERTRLGGAREPGQHDRLGAGAMLGDRAWDIQSKVKIRGGPMDYRSFERLRPGQELLKRTEALTRAYLGPGIGMDFEWSLESGQVQPARLGSSPSSDHRLGRSTWLEARTPDDYTATVSFSSHA